MGVLSEDLRDLGYEPTGEESPFDERGRLWSNGHEAVCDETGIVIEKDNRGDFRYEPPDYGDARQVFRYRHSGRVKMVGGYTSNYFD